VNCLDFAATITQPSLVLLPEQDKTKGECSACGYPLQDLTHLLLDCLASELLRRAIFGTTSIFYLGITSFNFDLWSRPWGVARMLGLPGILPHSQPSEGVG